MRRQFAELRTGSRRTRVLAACGAIAAAALAVGIIIGTGPESSQGASPKKGLGGASTVQRRDLVSTDTESGTLTYANPQTVFNRLSGTITWLPQIGQLIKPGHALYYVDNAPVVLFTGTTPAFRDLTSSDSDGPDILELNQDLKAMGFDPSDEITANDSWQTGTTNAVEAWQNSIGQTETGTISLGQIVFLPGTQRIDSIDTVLGSTGGAGAASSSAGSGASSSSGSSGSSSSDTGSGSSTDTSYAPKPQFVSLTMTKMVPEAVTAEAQAKAIVVENKWSQACHAHDLARLTTLKHKHPKLLAKLQPSACVEQQATSTPKPTPTTTHAAGTAPTTTASAPATTTTATSAPASTATAPANTTAAPSLLSQTLGADMAVPAAYRKPGSGSGTPTSTSSGTPDNTGAGALSGGTSNATITRALQALLRAETLLLERSSGSSGRSGSSGSSSFGSVASSTGSAESGRGSGGSSAGGAVSSGGSSSGTSGASTGSSGSAGSGSTSGGSSAQAIIGTTSNQLDVVVDLDATKQSEAVVKEPVSVEMPDGSTVSGKITQVSPVAQSSSGSSGSSGSGSSSSGGSSSSSGATIPVTIALQGRIPASGLDQAAVSVNFEQQVANNVLSVPVTALLATQGGGYAVQEAVAPYKLLPVSVGLFAAGYVQISSSQIYPGLQVTDSQG